MHSNRCLCVRVCACVRVCVCVCVFLQGREVERERRFAEDFARQYVFYDDKKRQALEDKQLLQEEHEGCFDVYTLQDLVDRCGSGCTHTYTHTACRCTFAC